MIGWTIEQIAAELSILLSVVTIATQDGAKIRADRWGQLTRRNALIRFRQTQHVLGDVVEHHFLRHRRHLQ
jgi:hypothetical protein